MSERLCKITGIFILCVGFGLLYYGAEVPATEIASISSKVLGVISGIGGSLLAFFGGKKDK